LTTQQDARVHYTILNKPPHTTHNHTPCSRRQGHRESTPHRGLFPHNPTGWPPPAPPSTTHPTQAVTQRAP